MRLPTQSCRSASFTRFFGILALLAVTGCPVIGESDDELEVAAVTGALGVHIKADLDDVDEIAYRITRNGESYRSGVFAIDGLTQNFSAVLGGIEPNEGYLLTLSADIPISGKQEDTKCRGSADFGVAAGETTVISMILRCQTPADPTLSERCPSVTSVRVLPSEAPVGKCVMLKSAASLIGKLLAPLTFDWSATFGHLSIEGPGTAKLECTEEGVTEVTVDMSTGDPQCARDSVSVYVTCRGAHGRRKSHGGSGGVPGPAAGSFAPQP